MYTPSVNLLNISLNEYKRIYQNWWEKKWMGHSQSMLTDIFIALNAYNRKDEKSQINKHSKLPLQETRKRATQTLSK